MSLKHGSTGALYSLISLPAKALPAKARILGGEAIGAGHHCFDPTGELLAGFGRNVHVNADILLGEDLLELDFQSFASRHVFRHDHGLTEEIVRQLNIERQIEPDGALADIGTPARHVRVILKDVIAALRHCFGRVDRGILRQGQIDQELRPVRRGKKLVGDQRDCKDRGGE